MRAKNSLRVVVLLLLIASLFPAGQASALLAPVNAPTFQLPWEQGLAWVALDGFDNGFKRALNSPHNYQNGGAVDFAPYSGMQPGVDTSRYWVTAVAAGTVTAVSSCSLKIDHGNGWTSDYQFLGNIQVRVGDAVYRNQRLAVIADGVRQPFCLPHVGEGMPHLHFALRPTLRNISLAGWLIQYNVFWNMTSYTKNGKTLGSDQPLLNTLDLQIVLRDPITWDTLYTGNVDAYRYERWPFALTETANFTLTATPTTAGLTPLLVLLDANGSEITHATGALTIAQPAGNYFVQVQPQAGAGFYNLLLHKNSQPLPTGPYVLTEVNPTSIEVAGNSVATVSLENVPAEGYTSVEFTCTYNASLVEASNMTPLGLFGPDPVLAVNGPQNGKFIVAIAGSKGSKATSSGAAFTFNVKGLQPGQTPVACTARISKGDNVLTSIDYIPATLIVNGSAPTPAPTSTPVVIPPEPTLTFTPPPTATASDWLTFTNTHYGFTFQYPPTAQIVPGGTDNFTRINLPFAPGTNLSEKYLDVSVAENANPCQSPLATSSMLETSTTVVFNGLSFLKQTGEDGTAGHSNKWAAYSTGQNNACVSLDFVLRAANPGVFATPPAVYDEAAETAVYDQIAATYAWLNLPSATPTPAFTPTPSFTPTPAASATPGVTPTSTVMPPTTGLLAGQVDASKTVTVSLYNADTTLAATVTASSDGSFSLEAPAGTYTVIAAASGFLKAQGTVTLTTGQTTNLPALHLLAGDIDGNNVIDQFDALTIGMNYNSAPPTAADLNNDGLINVLDLELLAANYRKTGPQPWQ